MSLISFASQDNISVINVMAHRYRCFDGWKGFEVMSRTPAVGTGIVLLHAQSCIYRHRTSLMTVLPGDFDLSVVQWALELAIQGGLSENGHFHCITQATKGISICEHKV